MLEKVMRVTRTPVIHRYDIYQPHEQDRGQSWSQGKKDKKDGFEAILQKTIAKKNTVNTSLTPPYEVDLHKSLF